MVGDLHSRFHFAGQSITVVLILCAFFAMDLRAQNQNISQMVHNSWTGKDGAPQAVSAFAQTPDGTLWIGSEGGLFMFDGLKFQAFQPKPEPFNFCWFQKLAISGYSDSMDRQSAFAKETRRSTTASKMSRSKTWPMHNKIPAARYGLF